MAKKPASVHTVPDRQGLGWAVKQDGETISRHHTKAPAERAGREEARQDGVEHLIHNRDGKIGERNSYGNDPYPPKG